MKRAFFTALLFTTLLATATAQYFPVDTARLNKAYRTLEQGNRTAETEMEFLEAFPTTWLEFYMTYSYIDDDNYDFSMNQIEKEHINTLFFLPHINDSILCKKIVNLSIGMKHNGEKSDWFLVLLTTYIFNNENLVIDYLSTLRKGHQMEFWQFCWSSVTECAAAEHFNELYTRNKDKYPEEMEISRVAFQHFYDGINNPALFPHKKEEYERKNYDKKYKYNFDDYKK